MAMGGGGGGSVLSAVGVGVAVGSEQSTRPCTCRL
jgi:hypothetical protein